MRLADRTNTAKGDEEILMNNERTLSREEEDRIKVDAYRKAHNMPLNNTDNPSVPENKRALNNPRGTDEDLSGAIGDDILSDA